MFGSVLLTIEAIRGIVKFKKMIKFYFNHMVEFLVVVKEKKITHKELLLYSFFTNFKIR